MPKAPESWLLARGSFNDLDWFPEASMALGPKQDAYVVISNVKQETLVLGKMKNVSSWIHGTESTEGKEWEMILSERYLQCSKGFRSSFATSHHGNHLLKFYSSLKFQFKHHLFHETFQDPPGRNHCFSSMLSKPCSCQLWWCCFMDTCFLISLWSLLPSGNHMGHLGVSDV